MAVTMRDVAKKAGVSLKTVSRVINGELSVAPLTREKVLNVISNLNFVPNLAAARLSRGRAMAIGLVLGWPIQGTFSAALTAFVLKSCESRNYGFSLFSINENIKTHVMQAYTGKQVDGLILDTVVGMDKEFIELLETYSVPYVVIHPGWSEIPNDISFVTIDDYSGAKKAVDYLLELGHKSIGYILDGLELRPEQKRLDGYRNAFFDAGIPYNEALIWKNRGKRGEAFHVGFNGAMSLLASQKDMSAIFCETDEVAIGAMSAIWQSGKTIPDDISIIGFDDIRYASMVVPPLTTICQPIEKIADASVKQLIQMLTDPATKPIHTILPTKLIVRNTTRKFRESGGM